jgi:hypothetical protein
MNRRMLWMVALAAVMVGSLAAQSAMPIAAGIYQSFWRDSSGVLVPVNPRSLGPIRVTSLTVAGNANFGGTTTLDTIKPTLQKVFLQGLLQLEQVGDTLANNAITFTNKFRTNLRIDAELGAALDTLDNIVTPSSADAGTLLILSTIHDARDVLVRDGIGNIALGANRLLSATNDRLLLVYHSTMAVWVEIAFADND